MDTVIYGYARVSDKTQNLDRQIDMLIAAGVKKEYILADKASGKDFNRRNYLSLVGTEEVAPRLQEGNLLIIVSLDRLGRNYEEIKVQWDYITKTLGADIRVLDIPLLDTSKVKDSLDSKFIADLVLQILSYISQKERENIRSRQQQGINSARARGKHLGRPQAIYPENWDKIYTEWKSGKITAVKAMELTATKRTTFYKLTGQFEKKQI